MFIPLKAKQSSVLLDNSIGPLISMWHRPRRELIQSEGHEHRVRNFLNSLNLENVKGNYYLNSINLENVQRQVYLIYRCQFKIDFWHLWICQIRGGTQIPLFPANHKPILFYLILQMNICRFPKFASLLPRRCFKEHLCVSFSKRFRSQSSLE